MGERGDRANNRRDAVFSARYKGKDIAQMKRKIDKQKKTSEKKRVIKEKKSLKIPSGLEEKEEERNMFVSKRDIMK